MIRPCYILSSGLELLQNTRPENQKLTDTFFKVSVIFLVERHIIQYQEAGLRTG